MFKKGLVLQTGFFWLRIATSSEYGKEIKGYYSPTNAQKSVLKKY